MGEDCRVYATPRIISDVEYTCRDFLLQHLDPGEDSVGTKVNWEHVGPALLGEEVTVSVKLIQVDGRRVTFEAAVAAGGDAVAQRHARALRRRRAEGARAAAEEKSQGRLACASASSAAASSRGCSSSTRTGGERNRRDRRAQRGFARQGTRARVRRAFRGRARRTLIAARPGDRDRSRLARGRARARGATALRRASPSSCFREARCATTRCASVWSARRGRTARRSTFPRAVSAGSMR